MSSVNYIKRPRNPNQPWREPFGHTYRPPKPCVDCGTMVEEMKGMERQGKKRCGRCDIRFCEETS